MQDCTTHQSRFTAYLDRELPPLERDRLEAHLAACPACAREWRLFTLTLDQVAALRHDQPPSDLLPGIRARLARPTLWQRLRDLVRHPDFSLSLPAATATVVAAMAVGLFLKMGLQPQLPHQPAPSVPGPVAAHRPAPIAVADSGLAAMSHQDGAFFSHARAAHPPMAPELAPLHPDIFITVRATSPHDLTLLHDALAERQLAARPTGPHGLVLHLDPLDLPLLREALGDREAVVFPPESVIPGYPHPKKPLTVAIRLR